MLCLRCVLAASGRPLCAPTASGWLPWAGSVERQPAHPAGHLQPPVPLLQQRAGRKEPSGHLAAVSRRASRGRNECPNPFPPRPAPPRPAAPRRAAPPPQVWALATLEFDPGKRLLQAIANALCERADQCNPQEVSNSVGGARVGGTLF